MERNSLEEWFDLVRRDHVNLLRGTGYGTNAFFDSLFEYTKEIHASSEAELFEMFVRGEIDELDYHRELPRFQTKPLTRVEQIRQSKPSIKQKFKSVHKLRSWE